MTKELKQEYTLKITQANKTQLITILYEMLLIYTKEAEQAYMREDRMEFREAIRKARGCVDELLNSLNFEYGLAMNFLQLYLYVNRELIRAEAQKIKEPLANVEKVVRGLHETYQKLEAMDTSGPVMQNVQTVYAGLTYGKYQLNENLADQGIDRGFRA
ncbi:MAG: flagellar protein FliS [Lachnospiraceae bacterium]|nr:flagellar protein FliS [Lachnospiraceae bacterium]